jgi:hypothetical protein
MYKLHNFYGNKAHSAFCPAPIQKTKAPLNSNRFGTESTHATATTMHFPANAGLIFLRDELMNDRYLLDTGAILSIVPCTSNVGPSGPLLKGADGQPILSSGFLSKTVQFQGKLFTAKCLQAAVAGPILGIDFGRKFRIIVAQETSQVLFACTAMAPATAELLLPNVSPIDEPLVSVPSATQKIPDSVPDDLKRLLQKFLSILHTGDVMTTLTYGVEHHSHTSSHPPVFAKSCRLNPGKT